MSEQISESSDRVRVKEIHIRDLYKRPIVCTLIAWLIFGSTAAILMFLQKDTAAWVLTFLFLAALFFWAGLVWGKEIALKSIIPFDVVVDHKDKKARDI